MSQPERRVDFDTLQRLDREADALIQAGQWTKEAFERLWQEAVVASGGQEKALEFLQYAADPGWLPAGSENTSGVYERIPRRVTELILRLLRGWEPRLGFSRAHAVVWNGNVLPSTRADVLEEGGQLRIRAQCSPEVVQRLWDEIRHYVPGTIIRNSLRTEHAGSWVVELENAAISNLKYYDPNGWPGFKTHPSPWEAHRIGARTPQCWIASIEEPITLHLGNLLRLDHGIISEGKVTVGAALGNCRLKGAYDYYIVQTQDAGKKRQYLIVDLGQEHHLRRELFHHDLLILKFLFGQRILLSTIYGLEAGQIVRCIGLSLPTYVRDGAEEAPAIDLHLEDYQRWPEPFFSKLSARLTKASALDLAGPVEAYISSRQGTIDRKVLELQMAILGLVHRTLGDVSQRADAPRELWQHQARLKKALEKLAIEFPSDLLDEIGAYSDRLMTIGRLTEEVGRSTEELLREARLLNILRTLLVAMIAASVGYRGPIRGIMPGEGSPSWWPIDPNEEQGIHSYVSVAAPTPIELPKVGADDLIILVEQAHHAVIVREWLEAAGLSSPRIHLVAGDGKAGLRDLLRAARETRARVILLAGSKQRNVLTAIDGIKKEFNLESVDSAEAYCAIPDIDAWLLADDELLREQSKEDSESLRQIDELPLPEETPDPYAVAHRLIGPVETWSFLQRADIYRASVRSPSLRHFLSRVAELLGHPLDLPTESASRSISRYAIAGLIRELMSADTVAWRTSDGHVYTAETISREVEQGTDAGHQYARDVVRVAIDFLRRQARRRGA